MNALLEHPAVQGGVAPFVVGLIVALALARTRYAWLAVVAGYLTAVALSTGISFSPLTASRKILLLAIVVAVVGLVLDRLMPRSRTLNWILAVVAGVAAVWTFWSILGQREGSAAWTATAAVAVFAGVMTLALMSLRDDPLRVAAATLGLGLATGVASVLSASIGFLLAGVAVAAAAGALLLVAVFTSRPAEPGILGTLMVGVLIALFAEGASLLAQMPWYASAALLLVPLAVRLPVREEWSVFRRAFTLSLYALAAASIPIAAAWFAARATPS
ncbi:MAG: hypothetical protein U1F54_08135 [Burkholderiales bacterium]